MHLNLLSHGNIFAFELQVAREDYDDQTLEFHESNAFEYFCVHFEIRNVKNT